MQKGLLVVAIAVLLGACGAVGVTGAFFILTIVN